MIENILLVRHGESEANVGKSEMYEVGDANICLTDNGIKQAKRLGLRINNTFLDQAFIYCSPYKRAIQTLQHIIQNKSYKYTISPLLREMYYGPNSNKEIIAQENSEERKKIGKFFYQFSQGESPYHCYMRIRLLMPLICNQPNKKKLLIISHGVTIRCIVTHMLNWHPCQYNSLKNPKNCELINLTRTGNSWNLNTQQI